MNKKESLLELFVEVIKEISVVKQAIDDGTFLGKSRATCYRKLQKLSILKEAIEEKIVKL